ncbi:MAG: hypothetical protein PHY05_09820 [Methanothrix sp.]|nr:hypothetical protein [Methanothrix sp.]
MPGGHPPTRGSALACGRVPGAAWQPGGGNPGRGGRARSGPCWGERRRGGDGPRAWAAGARALGSGGRWQRGHDQVVAEARSDGICYPIVSAAIDDQKSLKEGVQ